jgi:hypothetical protein
MEEMKVGTKAFYDLMENFEKNMKDIIYGHKLDKEIRGTVPNGQFYCDGFVNSMFHSYMRGYQYCRLNVILGE